MACNFLPIRDINKNSDTLSEASESGTTTSEWTSNWDIKEELKELLSKLGLKEVSDLHQDQFRVDRKRLEEMLTGEADALIPADVFFANVMENTNTYITWPTKLKIGAKSKKDPRVRIAGRPEDVRAAKERILTLLDTRCNRITMKLDVSYTDHSHIIGKGGLSIKRVMEETQCHVHFPDSNRSNPLEKSNQVSISGDIRGVEIARSRVRELTPLIFGFELPIMTQNIDITSSYIIKIQEQYRVQVIFKTRPKLHATLVLVKGLEWEVEQVKQATILLMEYMCQNLASQIPVQMSMEISPHHHPMVLGKNHINLKLIIQETNCQIMFPDAGDPNIPNLRKSKVNISGNINEVYKARQLLIGSLPLMIIFDLPEKCTTLRTKEDQVMEIMHNFDVTISIREKAKQNARACVIKGVEKNVGNIYKARNYILGLDEVCVEADIPPSYHLHSVMSASQASPTSSHPRPAKTNGPMTPVYHDPSTPVSPQNCGPPFVGMVQQPQFVYNVSQHSSQHSMGSSGYQSMSQFTNSSLGLEQTCENETYSNSSKNSSISSSISSPKGSSFPFLRPNNTDQGQKNNELPSVLNFSSGYHGPSVDRRQDNATPADFDSKRLAGFRAMQSKPTNGAYRQPNSSWSGYYISHTSPNSFVEVLKQKKQYEEEVWKVSSKREETLYPNLTGTALNNSDILDHSPNRILNNTMASDFSELPTLLSSLGLDRFNSIFTKHEIDLTVFSTLTEKDLIEIGINTFGARRKILLAISELNQRANSFSAAPGAERKKSSPRSSSSSASEKW